MSIQALPEGTVRTIGASQVLTEAAAVVKELIDNALDANATSLQVEISANTLDVIQLRDNGHGIAPEDRSLVCRRYCTSKIRDISDITGIGGTSLGFRGEALASASELSGGLTVTTRVDGEDVAVALKIARNGEVAGRDRASHPIGTTVRITSLFEHIPVRKQTALKAAAKSLAKIKRLLQSYAFSRPSVRFSLRVLKAKNTKDDWIYAPTAGAAKENAAFKIVGAECAGQCRWSVLELDGFEVQAFLPRADAEASKISGVGHFVSVDGRPVATTRTTFKQIITKYRSYLRAAAEELDGVKDPFAWINISCPHGSYDPNIEPAKDDVLFEDKDKVLNLIETMLRQCYPASAKTTKAVQAKESPPQASEEVNSSVHVPELDDIDQERRSAKRMKLSHDVRPESSDDPIYLDAVEERTSEDNDPDTAEDLRNVNVSNPWIMAKMNAPVRARHHTSSPKGQLLTPLKEHSSNDIVSLHDGNTTQLPPHLPWTLPSPRSSPIRPRPKQAQEIEPMADEPRLLDIGPDDSVSVVNNDYDDIDPSLANRYKAKKPKRYTGWQRPSQGDMGDQQLDFESAAPPYFSPHPFNPRKQGADTDNETHDTVLAPGNSKESFGNPKHISKTTKQAGARIMDIRDAFGTGDENTHSQPNTARKFKPFKPLLPARRALELADANNRLMADFERDQTLLSEAGSQAPVNSRRHLHREPPLISDQSIVDDTDNTDMNEIPDQAQVARKPHRTTPRTSHLPLEQIPVGQQINNLVCNLHVSIESLSKLTRIAYASQPATISSQDGSIHFPAGGEPWGRPCVDTLSSEDAARGGRGNGTLESTLLIPEVDDDEVTDWRESIYEYLSARGELEDGVTSSMLNSHLQDGLASSMR